MIKALGPAFGHESEDGQEDEDKFMRAAPAPVRALPTVSARVSFFLFVRSRETETTTTYFRLPLVVSRGFPRD